MPQDDHPYRSVLYMPGSRPRALEKARTLAADVQKLQQETTALDAERNELVASNTQIGSEIAHGSTMDLTI